MATVARRGLESVHRQVDLGGPGMVLTLVQVLPDNHRAGGRPHDRGSRALGMEVEQRYIRQQNYCPNCQPKTKFLKEEAGSSFFMTILYDIMLIVR